MTFLCGGRRVVSGVVGGGALTLVLQAEFLELWGASDIS